MSETSGQRRVIKHTTELTGAVTSHFISAYEKAEEQRRLQVSIDAERQSQSV